MTKYHDEYCLSQVQAAHDDVVDTQSAEMRFMTIFTSLRKISLLPAVDKSKQ